MKKTDKNAKIVTGAIVGGIIGIALILSLRKHKETSLSTLGTTISHLSELFENNKIEEPAVIKELGKKMQIHESTLLEMTDWVITGIKLWKKFHG